LIALKKNFKEMRVTSAHRVLKSKRARPRKLFKSLPAADSDTFVHDMPQSTLLPAPVLQTPAMESESNSMDTSSEGCDRNRVVAEKMTSSDALSFGSSEQQAASSEEPPTPTSAEVTSARKQLAMLTELFHEQSNRMHELEDELTKLKGQAGSSHPQFQPQVAGAASEFL
jgi:myosin heavy subunit